ncbi:MAG: PAS domain S-box protein [Candidatus Methylacidiphilales bacterium]|nr:PAS domain S-box protein [Candidatus Methylacidiphilales bacterium]
MNPASPDSPVPLRVLMLEDNRVDADLNRDSLCRAGFAPEIKVVVSGAAYEQALNEPWDLILADYNLPDYDGRMALDFLTRSGRDVPFILISGTLGEEHAVEAIRSGADDYLMKDRLGRLGTAVRAALEKKRLRNEKRAADTEALIQRQILEQTGEVAGVGGWRIDLKDMRLEWTEQTRRIHEVEPGYRPDIDTAIDFYAPEARPVIRKAVNDCILYGTPWDLELPLVTAKGRSIWIRAQGKVVRHMDHPIYLVGAFQDITQRRLQETRLRLLNHAVENLTDIVIVTDAEMLDEPGPKIVFVNPAFERISGYTAAEALGRSPRMLQGQQTSTSERKRIRQALEQKVPVRVELINYNKSGETYWIEMEIIPLFDLLGKCTHFVAVQREITQRKQSETQIARQAALIDKAHDAILVRDMDYNIRFWNAAAERIYGWKAEEVLGRSSRELIPIDREGFDLATEELVRAGSWSGKVKHRAKDGRILDIDASWTLLRDTDGRPESVLVINSDITEHLKLERQFLRAQRMESIGTLAGGIAHDLNNMLAPILLSIDTLKIGETNPMRLKILDTILNSTRRGADIVKQVLLFGRGVEGQQVPVQLGQLLTEIHRFAVETFPKNISPSVRVEEKLPLVRGDNTQLHQVLLNLCVNARDAMPDGGKLVLSAKTIVLDEKETSQYVDAKPGVYVLMEVEDSGAGIPPEIIDRIFDPFFTTKEMGRGTGLGLSTSAAIIKSHEGFMRVYSELGKGTTFRVYLPAVAEKNDKTQEFHANILSRGRGEMVLLVDDEVSVREIARQTLEAFGYKVLMARDGAEAIALYAAQRESVDLVLTDMMMPVMDGSTLIQILRRMNPDVRIVAASGLCSNQDSLKAASLGVPHFLPKPFTAEELLGTLRKALDEGPTGKPSGDPAP